MLPFKSALAAVVLTGGLAAAGAASAAFDYDNCTGFIDSLPATITTQGTWCLRKDLNTAQTYGAAINIATNNVTLDCNDFRIGGMPAGPGTFATGVEASGRLNATVRHCNIRGFQSGLRLGGAPSGGHVVENNRLDGNTVYGLVVGGDGSIVRGNQIRNTGGAVPAVGFAYGISTMFNVDVIDNTVNTVYSEPEEGTAGSNAGGIVIDFNVGGVIRGNRLRWIGGGGVTSSVFALVTDNSDRVTIEDNDVVGPWVEGPGRYGIACNGPNAAQQRAKDNIVNGFDEPLEGCRDDGNSL